MKAKPERTLSLFPALVAFSLLFTSLTLPSCGGRDGGGDAGTGTTAESETTREPLSTVHIDIDKEKDTSRDETDAETGDGSGAVLAPTLDMGTEYTDKFTFLCDSVIYGLKSLGMLTDGRTTDKVVTGLGGSLYVMTEEPLIYAPEFGETMTIAGFCAKKRPEYLLVSLGASDVVGANAPEPDEFEASYSNLIKLITEASPETVVICLSLLPGSSGGGISLYETERYNERILRAAENAGVYYLDAASSFAASNGHLREDCDAGDSRLSATGLVRLLEFIRTHYIGKGTE